MANAPSASGLGVFSFAERELEELKQAEALARVELVTTRAQLAQRLEAKAVLELNVSRMYATVSMEVRRKDAEVRRVRKQLEDQRQATLAAAQSLEALLTGVPFPRDDGRGSSGRPGPSDIWDKRRDGPAGPPHESSLGRPVTALREEVRGDPTRSVDTRDRWGVEAGRGRVEREEMDVRRREERLRDDRSVRERDVGRSRDDRDPLRLRDVHLWDDSRAWDPRDAYRDACGMPPAMARLVEYGNNAMASPPQADLEPGELPPEPMAWGRGEDVRGSGGGRGEMSRAGVDPPRYDPIGSYRRDAPPDSSVGYSTGSTQPPGAARYGYPRGDPTADDRYPSDPYGGYRGEAGPVYSDPGPAPLFDLVMKVMKEMASAPAVASAPPSYRGDAYPSLPPPPPSSYRDNPREYDRRYPLPPQLPPAAPSQQDSRGWPPTEDRRYSAPPPPPPALPAANPELLLQLLRGMPPPPVQTQAAPQWRDRPERPLPSQPLAPQWRDDRTDGRPLPSQPPPPQWRDDRTDGRPLPSQPPPPQWRDDRTDGRPLPSQPPPPQWRDDRTDGRPLPSPPLPWRDDRLDGRPPVLQQPPQQWRDMGPDPRGLPLQQSPLQRREVWADPRGPPPQQSPSQRRDDRSDGRYRDSGRR